jgi:TetR/AcrR family transcriptional regulator, ethionamide resistance regulator
VSGSVKELGSRRRRTPEEAQQEIIAAAEGLLRERPFRELTVDEVMRRTGLSRPSFYVYFKDRHELVLRVVQLIQDELLDVANQWLRGSGDGPKLLEEAMAGVVDVYDKHGHVLRALADAAADDPGVELAYGSLVQTFVDETTRHLAEELEAGEIERIGDPAEVAMALIWMNERYLYLTLGSEPKTDPRLVAATLTAIWTRALYPRA